MSCEKNQFNGKWDEMEWPKYHVVDETMTTIFGHGKCKMYCTKNLRFTNLFVDHAKKKNVFCSSRGDRTTKKFTSTNNDE